MARIAIGGWQHETNSFASDKATLQSFLEADAWPGLSAGDTLIGVVAGANIPIAGFIDAARSRGHQLEPLLWASAAPSGPVTETAFETIASSLVGLLEAAAPVDAVYLDLHGAMVSEVFEDGEGEILRRVREVIGPDVPLVASLDLHANVSAAMVDLTDAMVGYRTYPHVDMAETGARAAMLVAQLLDGERLAKAHLRLPFLLPLVWQCTLESPMADLMRLAASLERNGVSSMSFLPGFPLADVSCSAPSVIGYGANPRKLNAAVEQLEAAIRSAAPKLSGKLFGPAEAAAEAARLLVHGRDGPIILADTQDNPGAGGSGDTVGLLRALMASGLPALVGVIHDPDAAAAAHAAGVGETCALSVGAGAQSVDETPIRAAWKVENIGTGRFLGTGPFYKGCRFELGPMALLRAGNVRVVVASRRQQAADQAMFRHVGVDPRDEALIALKSSVHFRADFAPIASAILVVCAPGANIADLRQLDYRNLDPAVRSSF